MHTITWYKLGWLITFTFGLETLRGPRDGAGRGEGATTTLLRLTEPLALRDTLSLSKSIVIVRI